MKLYIKQRVFSWGDKFSIYDEAGNVIGKQMQALVYEGMVFIELVGSGESRLLKAGEMVNIIQTGENYYVFDGETEKVVLENLRDFNAYYLRDSLGSHGTDMTEEEIRIGAAEIIRIYKENTCG